MIRDGDKLSGYERRVEIFMIAVSFAFDSLCLRSPLLFNEDCSLLIWMASLMPFQTISVQDNNVFVLKRLLSGIKVGINGRLGNS